MRRIGILTSGGDAPGMNAAIRAAVRTATRAGIEIVGYRNGFTGLIAGETVALDDRLVGNAIHRSGTMLGTSRSPEFLEAEQRGVAARKMAHDGVDGLIVIGGDGSFRGALALASEHDIAIAGIPGTIDNDVAGTEETIGFHTAVHTAVEAIDKLRDTSESTGMTFFVEVMGRQAGAIAVATAVAAGATAVFVPEVCEDTATLATQIQESIERGKRSHIIIVAEGNEAGGALAIAGEVGGAIDQPYRVTVLGHIQRGGSPVPRDRIVASWAGAGAVEALAAGRRGIMIGMQGGRPVEVDLATVVESRPNAYDDALARLADNIAG